MAELRLEPYAVVRHWQLPGPEGRWEAILAEYLQTLAERCVESGQAVIGHIKTLACFPGGKYLRLSVVAADLPATVDGAAPCGCTSMDLTLNVLVYGLEWGMIEKIVQETSRQLTEKMGGEIACFLPGSGSD